MSNKNCVNVKMVDGNLVEKILKQGQKLRNAMIGSILKLDPFSTEIIHDSHFITPITSRSELYTNRNLTSLDEKRIRAFIKGEYMAKEEEKLALDTLRSMSSPDLYRITEKSLNSVRDKPCTCYICKVYNSNALICDLGRQKKLDTEDSLELKNEVTENIQEKYKEKNIPLMKYIDCLRVSVNSLILNETGIRSIERNEKVPYLNYNYFLEYRLPDSIRSNLNKSKINSLESNYVRLCSKRNNDAINFKQVTIHDIKNLDKLNLGSCEIIFKFTFRHIRQKSVKILGFAKFNFESFLLTKNLTCCRGLTIYLSQNSPIAVGTIKISLQLGCGRLYFGQEFLDALNSHKGESVVLDSEDSTNNLEQENISSKPIYGSYDFQDISHNFKRNSHKKVDQSTKHSTFKTSGKLGVNFSDDPQKDVNVSPEKNPEAVLPHFTKSSSYFNASNRPSKKDFEGMSSVAQSINENEIQILFGFLYISEAQYFSDPINTYITCRPFCQNETSSSNLVTFSKNPIFNFCQVVPLIFQNDLLLLLRENYMVIEFWQKTDVTNLVIGLTKVPLHQFYLAYRNPVILKYLCKNKLPVIGSDWWEPIYTVDKEEILGQVQVLAAVGTEDQIENFKSDRGFTDNIVKAKVCIFRPLQFKNKGEVIKSPKIVAPEIKSQNLNSNNNKTSVEFSKSNNLRSNFTEKSTNTSGCFATKIVPKLDIGTQSDMQMQEKNQMISAREILGSFLNQLRAENHGNIFEEKGINTEITQTCKNSSNDNLQQAQMNTNLELRKTTDLLDSLQKALIVDNKHRVPNIAVTLGFFKANVTICSANHLPSSSSRKKYKSKKSRNRSNRNEENILPSCYVTFETIPNQEVKISPVIIKSTNPIWNYSCDVNIPVDLLTDTQKRLIFKIWKKPTINSMSPNMQTDVVLGFAAVDLNILLTGFPSIQGWYNIVDFAGKCNGQINIHVKPLENISKYQVQKKDCKCNAQSSPALLENQKQEVENEPSELSRALKRKFTELDEITQRLRLRLSTVTNQDSDASNDSISEEFEKDINTLCVEENFDLIDFEEQARKFNMNYIKESGENCVNSLIVAKKDEYPMESEMMQIVEDKKFGESSTAVDSCSLTSVNKDKVKDAASLDKYLFEGKQQLNRLLEKLSLLSAESSTPFTSRYISGCSVPSNSNTTAVDTETILKELDHSARPNIHLSTEYDSAIFRQIYDSPESGNSLKINNSSTIQTSNTSSTSLITNFSESRYAPDGEGNTSSEVIIKKDN